MSGIDDSEDNAGREGEATSENTASSPPGLGGLSFDTGSGQALDMLQAIIEQPVVHGGNGLGDWDAVHRAATETDKS